MYSYADANQSLNAQVWTSWYRLNLFSDFTFFINDPVNGDGIEQQDKRFLGGTYLNYRRNYALLDIPNETLVGFSSRTDRPHVGLFTQMRRQRLGTTTDSLVNQTNLAWYAQQEVRPTSWLRTQIGVRLDISFSLKREMTERRMIRTTALQAATRDLSPIPNLI
jgi:hypothetical protein